MTRDCRPRSPLVWTVEPSTNVLALSCQTMSLTHNNLAGFSFSSTSGLDTRLEVSYFGTPAMVCTRNVNALRLMCRQAGYSSHFAFLNTEVSKGYYNPPFSPSYNYGSTSYERARSFLYNLRCSDDNATDLSSCEYDHFEVEDCDDNFAIVKCLDVPPSSGWRFRLNRHGVRGGSAGASRCFPHRICNGDRFGTRAALQMSALMWIASPQKASGFTPPRPWRCRWPSAATWALRML